MRLRLLPLLLALAVALGAASALAPPAGAQPVEDDVTTTSLVIDNREMGNIIQKPNAGKPAEDPGDPGGWLQVTLFFLIVGVVVLLVVGVAWRSKVLREQRRAAGLDPVDVAKRTGEGVRQPPSHPPTPVDWS
ncbi:MAG: hypothetical protein ACKO04_05360 [Actinomycetes bacterium]